MFAEVKALSARLVAPGLRRAHDIAGDADDAVLLLLTEQVERLDGVLGQARKIATL
jgi:hypothetical protein